MTRNQRASLIGIGLACRLLLPAPDAAIDPLDRPHLAFLYAGALAEPVITTPDILELIGVSSGSVALWGASDSDALFQGAD